MHLKEWIISEPEIQKLHLTSDCEFFIMASDGLWDKVNIFESLFVYGFLKTVFCFEKTRGTRKKNKNLYGSQIIFFLKNMENI